MNSWNGSPAGFKATASLPQLGTDRQLHRCSARAGTFSIGDQSRDESIGTGHRLPPVGQGGQKSLPDPSGRAITLSRGENPARDDQCETGINLAGGLGATQVTRGGTCQHVPACAADGHPRIPGKLSQVCSDRGRVRKFRFARTVAQSPRRSGHWSATLGWQSGWFPGIVRGRISFPDPSAASLGTSSARRPHNHRAATLRHASSGQQHCCASARLFSCGRCVVAHRDGVQQHGSNQRITESRFGGEHSGPVDRAQGIGRMFIGRASLGAAQAATAVGNIVLAGSATEFGGGDVRRFVSISHRAIAFGAFQTKNDRGIDWVLPRLCALKACIILGNNA